MLSTDDAHSPPRHDNYGGFTEEPLDTRANLAA